MSDTVTKLQTWQEIEDSHYFRDLTNAFERDPVLHFFVANSNSVPPELIDDKTLAQMLLCGNAFFEFIADHIINNIKPSFQHYFLIHKSGLSRVLGWEYGPESCQSPPTLNLIFSRRGFRVIRQINPRKFLDIGTFDGTCMDHKNNVYKECGTFIYIQAIGTAKEARGKGVGTEMMRYLCNIADEKKQAVYLEASSARSHEFYKRFGFVDLEEIRLHKGDATSVPVWCMLRRYSGKS